ncbi:MAG TPA: ABC transporter ATP-binding protein [Candidatus Nanopelagicales bacterium]|nr:ABC transporter ATP-binding protein [Candidatus Nanopelagicales bacterium]
MSLARLPLPDPGQADLRSPARFLVWTARRQWRTLSLGVLWGSLWMLAQGAVPAALGIAVGAAADGDVRLSALSALAVLVLGVIQSAAGVLRHRMAVTNWITAASRTQQLVVRHSTHLGASLSREVATGEVVAVTSSDVEKIGTAFDVLARLAGAMVAFVAVAIVLLRTSTVLGVLVLVGAPVLAAAVGPLLGPLERRESAQRELLGRSSALASDTVAGLRVLRGIGGEDLFIQRFRESSQLVRTAAVAVARVRSLLESLQVALPGALVVAITWLGAHQVLAGELGVGQLVAFYGYTAFLVLPLRTFTEAAQRWTSAFVAARRVVRLLGVERPDEQAEVAPRAMPSPVGAVLHDPMSGLRVEPGTLTAVMSPDPQEVDAIALRLGGYGPAGGHVTWGGVPLGDLDRGEVRSAILVQDKDPTLLSGTLAELFDVPASGRVTLTDAVRTAAAEDVLQAVVDADPFADATRAARITERGRSLSGGQRQRLALVRSLLVDPPVLVLDEPTSAVDAHTEARIADALRAARAGRTTVVLSSSPLVLDRCDEVVFVRDGRVRARGPHRRLLREDPGYRAAVTREEVDVR